MFGRVSFLYKGLKEVAIDQEKSQLRLKGTKFPLVLLRPYDLVQLGALVASGSEDILIWVGKTIGKDLSKALQSTGDFKKKEKLVQNILETLSHFGFGKCTLVNFDEGKGSTIKVFSSISADIKDKSDAKVLCNLYNGIFIGMFSSCGLDVEGEEKECILKGNPQCTYQYKFGTA